MYDYEKEAQIMNTSRWLSDTAERVGMTFVIAFLGMYVPALTNADNFHALADMGLVEKALFAGVLSALTLIKSISAKWVGRSDSASLNPDV